MGHGDYIHIYIYVYIWFYHRDTIEYRFQGWVHNNGKSTGQGSGK